MWCFIFVLIIFDGQSVGVTGDARAFIRDPDRLLVHLTSSPGWTTETVIDPLNNIDLRSINAAIPFTISSNETSPEHQIFSGSRERRQIVVPLSTKQKPCVLLPHPEHGLYQVTNVPDASPGDSFDSLELRVTCRRGYGFLESGGNGILKLYCVNGIWSQGIPKCVRFCKLDPDPSVRYMCQVLGVGYRICDRYVSPGTTVDPVCNSPIYSSPETLSYMKCIAGFWDYVAKCKPECGRVTPKGEQLVIGGERAKRGELPWHTGIYKKTSTPYMQICGGSLVSNNVVISAAHCFWTDVQMQLPASKFAAAVGKLYRPWNNERDLDVQKSDVKEILLPPLFYGSSANFQEDIAVVVLVTPVVYKTFVRPVCLNFDLNFDRWQLQDGKLGKVAGWGLFAPNGKASQVLQVVQLPYINLKTCVNTVPLSFREFITADKFCAGYTNGTALCKGDSGGGLAFSAYTELDIERYYLRGVVSAAPSSDDLCNANTYTAFTKITRHEEFIKQSIASADKLCPPYLFQCDDGTCVDQGADCDGKQDCADGSDEANELCIPSFESSNTSLGLACILPTINNGRAEPSKPNSGQFLEAVVLVTCKEGYDLVDSEGLVSGNSLQMSCRNGTWDQNVPNCTLKTDCGQVFDSKPLVLGDRTARRGELPWHAAIYSNNKDPYEHICGGNIISRYAVLSAAHCYRNGQPPSSYAVASGKMNGPWDHEDDVEVQRSDVKEIKISNLYNQKDAKDFKADLAVLILEKQITFTSYIKPVCLNFDNFEKEEMTNGILARVAAWSFTSKKSSHLQILKAVDMTYLSLKICNNTLAEGLAKFNTVDKVCAGYAKDRRVFRSLAGSGIVLPRVQSAVTQYYLQGVLAYVVPCLHCVETSDAYYMFTSVFQNKDFIKQFI